MCRRVSSRAHAACVLSPCWRSASAIGAGEDIPGRALGQAGIEILADTHFRPGAGGRAVGTDADGSAGREADIQLLAVPRSFKSALISHGNRGIALAAIEYNRRITISTGREKLVSAVTAIILEHGHFDHTGLAEIDPAAARGGQTGEWITAEGVIIKRQG